MLCTYVVRRWLRLSTARHVVKLTPQQVTNILQTNEHTHGVSQSGVVGHYDTNQLPSNSPCEDQRSEAVCRYTGDHLLGVYDGHGGGACAVVTASRLPSYIAASLLGQDQLMEHLERLEVGSDTQHSLLERCNAISVNNAQLEEVHEKSYASFVRDLAESEPAQDIGHGLQRAFLRLDEDIGREAVDAVESSSPVAVAALRAASSGCVACVAHLAQSRLYLANTGDCRAVLGVLNENGHWVARPLTKEHDCDNPDEVQRITERHPSSEHHHLLKDSRLLGMLAPLRAIGDYRFKWPIDLQERIVPGGPFPELKTPPYLTAAPEITYHKLTPRDRFLIMASDGLWEQLPASEVVRLVGEHAHGKTTLTPLRLPRRDHTLNQLLEMLEARRKGIGTKPQDANAATHVLRHALSGTEYGLNHGRISQLLTLPEEVVRLFRDDITITVVMFNPDALRPN
ncbi:pyruvate dehydrogenase [acetyl-transferring]-phosphatase 1, mitochondrial-like isoform X1 [Amphibalanus amphitrite]|uniref:pyruvate dehydrogenase [acetyl-transferring]-phosphatase 1, mitochondrial-like isoform X1 n=1 Tax=Amphibalanus amphitrite TaxID=1232801 RepID=UPI001C90AEEF|nr:pyruvate dehydrogenase [acetyl-transferring]-phosphatase 1, mitochondrial-like isoform X1 [Amphibalanus amphitrite]XP_043244437.1 pyruvate dehydrogenase [acetyl-transferring]-phosphatase 1, mitochondrial-like isoform X1 [Amphibalanus amphitrite]